MLAVDRPASIRAVRSSFHDDSTNPDDPSHNSSPWVVWNEREQLWFLYFHFYNHAHAATTNFQPTALANEAYLKLIDQSRVEWQGRAHFLAVAAQAMRRLLIDHARARGAQRRGGGWNRVEVARPHPVIGEGYYYFVHSYRPVGAPEEVVVGATEYGERFPSAVGTANVVAVQFHPEKSQRKGLALLERFLEWTP